MIECSPVTLEIIIVECRHSVKGCVLKIQYKQAFLGYSNTAVPHCGREDSYCLSLNKKEDKAEKNTNNGVYVCLIRIVKVFFFFYKTCKGHKVTLLLLNDFKAVVSIVTHRVSFSPVQPLVVLSAECAMPI